MCAISPFIAGSNDDYEQTSTSITLTGQETQVISVRLINDEIYEFTESFIASLSASGVLPSFVTLGPETAQVDIADDDSTLVDVCVCVHIIPGPKSSVFRKKALTIYSARNTYMQYNQCVQAYAVMIVP